MSVFNVQMFYLLLGGLAFPNDPPAAAAGDFLFFPLFGYVGPVPRGVVTPAMLATTLCSSYESHSFSVEASGSRSKSVSGSSSLPLSTISHIHFTYSQSFFFMCINIDQEQFMMILSKHFMTSFQLMQKFDMYEVTGQVEGLR